MRFILFYTLRVVLPTFDVEVQTQSVLPNHVVRCRVVSLADGTTGHASNLSAVFSLSPICFKSFSWQIKFRRESPSLCGVVWRTAGLGCQAMALRAQGQVDGPQQGRTCRLRWSKRYLQPIRLEDLPACSDLRAWMHVDVIETIRLPNPPLRAVAYVSEVRRPWSVAEIDRLLVSSSAVNAQLSITGVLLYDGLRFFQYIEGPPANLLDTYDRIKRSSRHDLIAEMYNDRITARHFPQGQMACRKVQLGSILEVSAQRWSRTRLALGALGEKPEVIQQVLAFWEGAESSIGCDRFTT